MRKTRLILLIIMVAVFSAIGGWLFVKSGRFHVFPDEINVHFSGGFSGNTDADLRVYGEGKKYYLVYEEHQTGDEKRFELTKEEYEICTHVNLERFEKAKQMKGADVVCETVTLKYQNGKKEKTFPAVSYSISPYYELKKLYAKKIREEEAAPLEKIDDALIHFFYSAQVKNATFCGTEKGTIYSFYGDGIVTVETENYTCNKEIMDQLASELAIMKLFDDGLLEKRERPDTMEAAKTLIEQTSGKSYEDYLEEDLTGNSQYYKYLLPKNNSAAGMLTYLGMFCRESEHPVSKESKDFLLEKNFTLTEAYGREAYVRKLRSKTGVAVMVWFPEENSCLAVYAENTPFCNDTMLEDGIKKILLSQGEESVDGKTYVMTGAVTYACICMGFAYLVLLAMIILRNRQYKKDEAGT